MARAVQCPACGHAHPIDTLEGTPTFSCTGCGRTLRTPTELVRPSGTTPAVRGAPKSAPASAAPTGRSSRRAPAPAPKTSRSTGNAPSSPAESGRARPRRGGSGTLGLPLRVAAWVVAVVFGLLLTWFLASVLGFISRSQLVDMFRSSSPTNYIRLFLLIPVWAFMSACLATALIEGTRIVLMRRGAVASGTPTAKARPPRPARATTVPEVDERTRTPEPAPDPDPDPLPPGQRTRIRPREPTV